MEWERRYEELVRKACCYELGDFNCVIPAFGKMPDDVVVQVRPMVFGTAYLLGVLFNGELIDNKIYAAAVRSSINDVHSEIIELAEEGGMSTEGLLSLYVGAALGNGVHSPEAAFEITVSDFETWSGRRIWADVLDHFSEYCPGKDEVGEPQNTDDR